jgi:hypothetical protein
VSLFLSDVETDTWSPQQLDAVAGSCDRVIVTLGEKGALLLPNSSNSQQPQHIPVVKVSMQCECLASVLLASVLLAGVLC